MAASALMVKVWVMTSRATSAWTALGSSPPARPKLPSDDQMRPSKRSSEVRRQYSAPEDRTWNTSTFDWSTSRVRMSTSGLMVRSEEHTSELQSLMRISYAVFCLKIKQKTQNSESK